MHFDHIERVSNFFFVCPRFMTLCDEAIDRHFRFFHERRHWASSTYERLFVPTGWRDLPPGSAARHGERVQFALQGFRCSRVRRYARPGLPGRDGRAGVKSVKIIRPKGHSLLHDRSRTFANSKRLQRAGDPRD
jgi:hypothetical protein